MGFKINKCSMSTARATLDKIDKHTCDDKVILESYMLMSESAKLWASSIITILDFKFRVLHKMISTEEIDMEGQQDQLSKPCLF